MKISEMLLREDFYKINEETLSEYFGNGEKTSKLYVYPQLNAIITAKPSKKVKQYLYNEYNIRGSRIKALAVKGYVFLSLNSFGMLAGAKPVLPNNMTADKLIYPCNKKYRIFDFKNNTVDVIAKKGFPTRDLEREIEFRSKHKADFIPELVSFSESGYRENIIDGVPLARVTESFDKLCEQAVGLVEAYARDNGFVKEVEAGDYVLKLKQLINDFEQKNEKSFDKKLLNSVVEELILKIDKSQSVTLTLSHGDLQPGNVWLQNDGKLFVIDWESWNGRSAWYDRAMMFGAVRSKGPAEYIKNTENATQWAIVCLEDIIFRLNELFNLPFDYGEKDFEGYLGSVRAGIAGKDE